MRAHEAHKLLDRAGVKWVRPTRSGHGVWELPDGSRRTLALNHKILDRNEEAFVRKAVRSANQLKEKLMTTTSMPEPEPTVPIATPYVAPYDGGESLLLHPSKDPPTILVYRTPPTTKHAFAELYVSTADAAVLGGVGAKVRLLDVGDSWLLFGTKDGELTIREESPNVCKIKSAWLAKAVPPTRRTAIFAERTENGFRVYPGAVETGHIARDMRLETPPEPRQASASILKGTPAEDEPSTPGDASAAPETAIQDTEAGSYQSTVAKMIAEGRLTVSAAFPKTTELEPTRHSATLEDLRAALNMVREIVADLDVTLYGSNGLSVSLDDIEFRGRA